MKKKLIDLKVTKNTRLNPDNFVLELTHSEKFPEIKPGQFVEIQVNHSKDVFLRRPFSIHNVNVEENSLSILIKRLGSGTRQLGYLEVDDYVNVMLPLGNDFTMLEKGKVLLVGGGCGIAPMMYLAKKLDENEVDVHILMGARTEEDIFEVEDYEEYGTVHVATENGGLGHKGMVTDHPVMKDELKSFNFIYSCGPDPMMKAVGKIAKENNIPCEVSLENTMACGIGACLCCVVDTVKGNVCTCTDGPVFNIKDLKW